MVKLESNCYKIGDNGPAQHVCFDDVICAVPLYDFTDILIRGRTLTMRSLCK